MKRRVVKVSLAILIVVGIFLGLVAVLALGSEPAISFGFLEGRTPAARVKEHLSTPHYRAMRYTYSFEADFNDVCTKADTELTTSGFRVAHQQPTFIRKYDCFDNSSEEWIQITIYSGTFRSHTRVTPQGSVRSVRHSPRKGWVSVEVKRDCPRLWPPQYLLYHLKRRLRRAASNPPAKKP